MVYAILGTIVAEFLGAQQGIGVAIMQAQAVTDVAGVFAALILSARWGSRCTCCALLRTACCALGRSDKHLSHNSGRIRCR